MWERAARCSPADTAAPDPSRPVHIACGVQGRWGIVGLVLLGLLLHVGARPHQAAAAALHITADAGWGLRLRAARPSALRAPRRGPLEQQNRPVVHDQAASHRTNSSLPSSAVPGHLAVSLAIGAAFLASSVLFRQRSGHAPLAAAVDLSDVDSSVAVFALQSAAASQCQRGKVCQAGPQPWRGPQYEELNCGEDSFFLASHALGLADGVAGSRTPDSDPSILANKLMQYAQEVVVQQPSGNDASPLAIMQEAYNRTTSEALCGAATVLIACVGNAGELRTANLGDALLLVIREGAVAFQTGQTVWGFNFPYMLYGTVPCGIQPSVQRNVPEESVVEHFQLQDGDLIVVGSDGVWDNLFVEEVLKILAASPDAAPEVLAAAILKDAVAASESRYRRTPFMVQADSEGMDHQGGKPDDCTVLVSRVLNRP
eukprot:EG_transcript_8403